MNQINVDTNHVTSEAVSGLNHVASKSVDPGFNADDAMNSALNFMVDTILTLTDVVISMGDMSTTIQKTAVKNAQSKVEMYRNLLSAQGLTTDPNFFNNFAGAWTSNQANYLNTYGSMREAFKHFCEDRGLYEIGFKKVYENPNMTDQHKDEYAFTLGRWYPQANGRLSGHQNNTSVISQQLNQASTYVQDWMSTSEAMKPTQIQQSVTTLIAQISQVTSMFTNVVGA